MTKSTTSKFYYVDITDVIVKYIQQFPFAKDIKSRINLDDLKHSDIDLGYLRIANKPTRHIPCIVSSTPINGLEHHMNDLGLNDSDKGKQMKSHILFSSVFTNNTTEMQTNHLRTERRTSSSCRLNITRGVTMENNFSLQIGPPNIALQANGAFRKEKTMSKQREQVFEEELVWSLDTEVVVPPKSKTVADLVITEDEYDGNFEVETVYDGRISVKLRDKKDGSLVTHVAINDLTRVFTTELGFKSLSDQPGAVSFMHEGHCQCQFGINQRVDLTETKLD